MPSFHVRVFVSSTWLDLQPERQAIEQTLQRFHETKFNGMEHFGSRDETTRAASLSEVDKSDLYVGVIGSRYGSGITEAEYRRARERRLPCFIYCKEDSAVAGKWQEADLAKAEKLTALVKELRSNHTITTFTQPDELAVSLAVDLHRWLFEEYLAPRLQIASERGDIQTLTG
ncbi:DUF4062 domain-containing protein [Gloeobacter morelensis]|uniref:DUF4062 domain-containing protein n=1 Tax=Gloeobacter morelensis MG652769 TaxID=2781736 RepID=A0ABY3PRU9_9CYAN|nr:DUF4062 domain-containing protein [Gloeobacter morelensis]UFP96437.1 DUF4062 domain-containing protein [Gloeobacter morelensis MG652769]